MKGDVIECMLAESLLTGARIPLELVPPRLALQQLFRVFDVAVDNIYRAVFRSWLGPPQACHMVNVADFSALVLLAHSLQTHDCPDLWRKHFDDLVKIAMLPLLRRRVELTACHCEKMFS